MKLKEGIVITEVSGKKVLVDAGSSGECFQGIIKLNESAALLAEKLSGGATLEDLVQAFVSEYEIDEATAKKDIEEFLAHLRETKMLED